MSVKICWICSSFAVFDLFIMCEFALNTLYRCGTETGDC